MVHGAGQLIYSLMYKAEQLQMYLLCLEQALIKKREEGLRKAEKPSWRRRSMALEDPVVEPTPTELMIESGRTQYQQGARLNL